MRRLISKLLCRLGVHGPEWFGNESTHRSAYFGPLLRCCERCGTYWAGSQVFNGRVRTLGDWERIDNKDQHDH